MMVEGENKPPLAPFNNDPNAFDVRKLQSARTLVTIASIFGPVSLFFGGVWASAAGLICGIIAWRTTNAIAFKEPETEITRYARLLKRSSLIAMAICGFALVLNTIMLFVMFPIMLEIISSGDLSSLGLGSGSLGSYGGSSAWG